MKTMAILLKSCCLCFSPRTGSVVLGCLGILVAVFLMVPHVLMLQNHDFYIREYVRQQRQLGVRDIPENDVPSLTHFSKMLWSLCVTYDVIFTFVSIFLISGVAAERRYLLVPWLVCMSLSLIFFLIILLAAMFGLANADAFVLFFISAPILLCGVYFWLNVYSTFHQMHQDGSGSQPNQSVPSAEPGLHQSNRRKYFYQSLSSVAVNEPSTTSGAEFALPSESVGQSEPGRRKSGSIMTQSASMSSFSSNNRRQSAEGSPPPPYDAVAVDIDKEKEAMAAGIKREDLIFGKSQTRSKSADNIRVAVINTERRKLNKVQLGTDTITTLNEDEQDEVV